MAIGAAIYPLPNFYSKSNPKMGDEQRHGFTEDEALSALGFGTFQGLAMIVAGIGWFSDAAEITLLSFIGPALRSEWSLSPTQESFLSTVVFGGMLIGAYFWGFVADAYGRRMAMRGVSLVMYGAGFLSVFSPNYTTLVVLRFFLGFGASGAHVFSTWFVELLPKSNRGAWMLVMSVSWIVGELLETATAWIIMPSLGWRWLLALSSLPSLVALLLSTSAPESPRYLHLKGRTDEAIAVLEKIAQTNRKKLPSDFYLVSHNQIMCPDEGNFPLDETPLLSSCENKKTNILENCLKYLCQLFSPDLLRTTILVWVLSFVYTFTYYGIQLLISALSSEQSDCSISLSILPKSVQNDSLYLNTFIACLAELPGYLFGMVLVDRLGRKFSMEILTILSMIAILPLLCHQSGNVTISLLVSSRMFLSAASTILNMYAKEVYPTSTRASGFGLANSVGRSGGMVCPLVAVGLVRGCHPTLAVTLFAVIILISGICVLVFPFETKGRALADTVTDTGGMMNQNVGIV